MGPWRGCFGEVRVFRLSATPLRLVRVEPLQYGLSDTRAGAHRSAGFSFLSRPVFMQSPATEKLWQPPCRVHGFRF